MYNLWPETLHWLVGHWVVLCRRNAAIGGGSAGFIFYGSREQLRHVLIYLFLYQTDETKHLCSFCLFLKRGFEDFVVTAIRWRAHLCISHISPHSLFPFRLFFFNLGSSTFDPDRRSLTGLSDTHTCLGVRGEASREEAPCQCQSTRRQTNLSQ